jgi:hypothetical protein
MVYNDQRKLENSNRHVQGTQVIDMKVQHSMTKGAWKDLQDDTRGGGGFNVTSRIYQIRKDQNK